jgi:hypothetical protein
MSVTRQLLVTAIAAGLLAFAGPASGAGTAAQHAQVKPWAAVVFGQGVSIVGRHFKPRERLRVSLVAFQTYTRRIRATATGRFRIDLGAISLNDCNAYTLKVVGILGSRFSLAHPTAPC